MRAKITPFSFIILSQGMRYYARPRQILSRCFVQMNEGNFQEGLGVNLLILQRSHSSLRKCLNPKRLCTVSLLLEKSYILGSWG